MLLGEGRAAPAKGPLSLPRPYRGGCGLPPKQCLPPLGLQLLGEGRPYPMLGGREGVPVLGSHWLLGWEWERRDDLIGQAPPRPPPLRKI